jgi:hypothetical protein
MLKHNIIEEEFVLPIKKLYGLVEVLSRCAKLHTVKNELVMTMSNGQYSDIGSIPCSLRTPGSLYQSR